MGWLADDSVTPSPPLLSCMQEEGPYEALCAWSNRSYRIRAALNPIYGAHNVARFFAGLMKQGKSVDLRIKFAEVNAKLGVLIHREDALISVLSAEIDEDAHVIEIFLIGNPDKLPRVPNLTGKASATACPDSDLDQHGVAAGKKIDQVIRPEGGHRDRDVDPESGNIQKLDR